MKHILSRCPLGLDRRTRRHNQVLEVLDESLKGRVDEINKGDSPKIEQVAKINFAKEGKAATLKNK